MNDAPSPTDSINSLDRRDFVRKSAFAAGALTFAGLISAGHAGPPSTTTNTTVMTTNSVLTVVGRRQTYYGTYTYPGLAGSPIQQILELNWASLYGGSGAEFEVTREPGPESNYVACSFLESLVIEAGNQPVVTDNPDGSVTVSMSGVTIEIHKRIKQPLA